MIENGPATDTPRKSPRQPRIGPPMRRRARQLLLRGAIQRAARPGIRVLAYHLMPEPSIFRAHIASIQSVAQIIDEDEFLSALNHPSSLTSGDCRVLLTFDDGYRQHLSHDPLEVVKKLGLRPTVFMLASGVDPSLGPPAAAARRAQRSPIARERGRVARRAKMPAGSSARTPPRTGTAPRAPPTPWPARSADRRRSSRSAWVPRSARSPSPSASPRTPAPTPTKSYARAATTRRSRPFAAASRASPRRCSTFLAMWSRSGGDRWSSAVASPARSTASGSVRDRTRSRVRVNAESSGSH